MNPRTGLFLVLLFAWPPAPGAHAQEAPGGVETATPVRRTAGTVQAAVRATRLQQESQAMWGLSFLLTPQARWALGAGGWALFERLTIDGTSRGPAMEMTLGYGGVLGRVHLVRGPRMGAQAELLLGAGNAKVVVPLVDAQIGGDNFLVAEPGVSVSVAGPLGLEAGLGLSYRFLAGVEDLPGLDSSDLTGASVTVSVSLGWR